MIVNNKSIQGIFIYSETSEYEKGDFVVSGDSIYVCTPKESDTVINKDPKTDTENYTLYLGGDKATWEDFEEQYTNPNELVSSDKLITSTVLAQILKKLAFGLDSNGIISEQLLINMGLVSVSPRLGSLLNSSGYNNKISVLDHLLLTDNVPEFNNMTVRVNRNSFKGLLPDIGNLIEGEENENNDNYKEIDVRSVILKQYTYYESTPYTESVEHEFKIRIQEVIDHINGVCLYRFSRLGSNDINTSEVDNGVGVPSSWKISCPNSQYLSKLNSLLKYVTEKSTSSSYNKFAFKDITSYLSEPTSEDSKTKYSLKSNTFKEELSLSTVTISTVIDEKITYNYSSTIDLTKNGTYAFPNDVVLKQTNNNNLTLSWNNDKISSVTISNIYVRSYEN